MSASQLASTIEALILAADSRFANGIGIVQNDLYNQLVAILKELEIDTGGYVRQSAANRKILRQAETKIDEIFSSPLYTNHVQNFVNTIPKIDLASVQYFTAIDENFQASRVFLKQLQADAIAAVEQNILSDGLQSQVLNPLKQILTQNVNTGGSFSGFMEQIKLFIKGSPEVDGRALSYTRTYLRDTLFTYARTFQQSIVNDLGLEFYLYAGALMDSSRDFCIERAGKFFHQKEIERWASLDWTGKKSGTTESSIFLFAAGWNCNHEIIPVSRIIVPEDVIKRAIDAGYIKS